MRIEEEIKREDWISRFFGYLGSLKYIRNKDNGLDGRTAENIVYIYSADESAMRSYKNLLVTEISEIEKEQYVCCGYDLKVSGRRIYSLEENLEFQKRFASVFQTKTIDFYFPCMEMLDACRDWRAAAYGVAESTLSSVNDFVTGNKIDKVLAATSLVKEMTALSQYKKNMLPGEVEVLTQLKKDIKKNSKLGRTQAALLDDGDPFDFLKLDLQTNSANKKNKKIICMIENFQICRDLLEAEEPRFLDMLMQVKDIIWVLFSTEKPNENVRAILKEENCWRMAGINKERTLHYLKEKCPGCDPVWYENVYKHTGGYLGLLDMCVQAQLDEKKRFSSNRPTDDEQEKMKAQAIELLKLAKLTGVDMKNIEEILGKSSKASGAGNIEEWFACVWNDGPWDGVSEHTGQWSNPVEIFLKKELSFVERDRQTELIQMNLLPCLCFLAKKSLENVGTINQFSWIYEARFAELNKYGHLCLQNIERSTPFCIEYVEYPGVLYLDPVIVRILSTHKKFDEWLKKFEECCCEHFVVDDEKNVLEKKEDAQMIIDEKFQKREAAKMDMPARREANVIIADQDVQALKSDTAEAERKEEGEKPESGAKPLEMNQERSIIPNLQMDTHDDEETTADQGNDIHMPNLFTQNSLKGDVPEKEEDLPPYKDQ